jgi:hypothetical protein
MRRYVKGYGTLAEHERFVPGFDWAVQQAYQRPEAAPNVETLCTLHDRLVGGQTLREGRILTGDTHLYPHPGFVRRLLEDLFEMHRSRLVIYGPVRAAAELHLDLLTIHAFDDGNGRTARAMASVELVRAGFRSTLYTAAEQHFLRWPSQYVQMLNSYSYGWICRSACILGLISAMALRSRYAEMSRQVSPLSDNEGPRHFPPGASAASRFIAELVDSLTHGKTDTESWHDFRNRLTPADQTEFDDQIDRLTAEEQDQAHSDHADRPKPNT